MKTGNVGEVKSKIAPTDDTALVNQLLAAYIGLLQGGWPAACISDMFLLLVRHLTFFSEC